MISDEAASALALARTALVIASERLRTEGERWASRDVDQALELLDQAIAELGLRAPSDT